MTAKYNAFILWLRIKYVIIMLKNNVKKEKHGTLKKGDSSKKKKKKERYSIFYMVEKILYNLSSPDHKYLQWWSPCSAFSEKMVDGNERECQIVNPVTRRKIQLAKLMGLFPLCPQSCCSTIHNLIARSRDSNPRCEACILSWMPCPLMPNNRPCLIVSFFLYFVNFSKETCTSSSLFYIF